MMKKTSQIHTSTQERARKRERERERERERRDEEKRKKDKKKKKKEVMASGYCTFCSQEYFCSIYTRNSLKGVLTFASYRG